MYWYITMTLIGICLIKDSFTQSLDMSKSKECLVDESALCKERLLQQIYDAQGQKGRQGEQGPRGPQGLQGAPGIPGLDGGPQGQKGEKGDTGLIGAVGRQGIEGPSGESGKQGDKGEKGEKGDRGPPIDPGPTFQLMFDRIKALEEKVNAMKQGQ